MSTITRTIKKSYQQIISAPMDIYVRRSDADDLSDSADKTFLGLGHTARDSTVMTISPVLTELDSGDHAALYNIKIKTTLMQAHADILDVIQLMKNVQNVDVLFYDAEFSTNNFIRKTMSMYIDGDVNIAARKARSIPVTFTGQFSDISEIFLPVLNTVDFYLEYFAFYNTQLNTGYSVFTFDDIETVVDDGVTKYAVSAKAGVRAGYYSDSADISPFGFNCKSKYFDLSAKIKTAALTGNEIGLLISNGEGTTKSYLFSIHGGKAHIWYSAKSGSMTLLKSFNLYNKEIDSTFTFKVRILEDVATLYQDADQLGSFNLPIVSEDGYYIGAGVKANNGAGSEDHFLWDIQYTSDLYMPKYLFLDDFEHLETSYSEVTDDYEDLETVFDLSDDLDDLVTVFELTDDLDDVAPTPPPP